VGSSGMEVLLHGQEAMVILALTTCTGRGVEVHHGKVDEVAMHHGITGAIVPVMGLVQQAMEVE
ncbi:hypothetical protein A2U01_0082047, partial [Trifolium medium]|nr:hypothetical protein [Trifolium medium]